MSGGILYQPIHTFGAAHITFDRTAAVSGWGEWTVDRCGVSWMRRMALFFKPMVDRD